LEILEFLAVGADQMGNKNDAVTKDEMWALWKEHCGNKLNLAQMTAVVKGFQPQGLECPTKCEA